jgi:hypothetical protein
MLTELSPMTHLFRTFFDTAPRRIGLDRITKGQDGQQVQGVRNSQELLDAVSVHVTDPTGAHPFIPAGKLHILHGPCTIDFMPAVGRVGDDRNRTARLFDEAPTGAQGAELLQHAPIPDGDEMPGLEIPCTGGEATGLEDMEDYRLRDTCWSEGTGGAPSPDALERIHSHLPAMSLEFKLQPKPFGQRLGRGDSLFRQWNAVLQARFAPPEFKFSW